MRVLQLLLFFLLLTKKEENYNQPCSPFSHCYTSRVGEVDKTCVSWRVEEGIDQQMVLLASPRMRSKRMLDHTASPPRRTCLTPPPPPLCRSYRAKKYGALLERAVFVSGRDVTSIKCLSSVLQLSKSPLVQPNDVAFVRDTVLSDSTLTDTDGTCWKQSEGSIV